MAIPSYAEQIGFLRNLQLLLGEGNFVSTYKFALLRSLADLAVDHGNDQGDALELDVALIAEHFIALYWAHTAPFAGLQDPGAVLRQNTGEQAAILRHIQQAQAQCSNLARFKAQPDRWRELVKKVRHNLRAQPLWKLQMIQGSPLPFLYPHTRNTSSITLEPCAVYCLRAFRGLIIHLIHGAWAQFVQKINLNHLKQGADLSSFLFGDHARGNLAPYQELLEDLQRGQCFYCDTRLSASPQVDHFIPWSLYPRDLGHNFVLAHASCNNDKSDHLAAVHHLERWCERNHIHDEYLRTSFDQRGLLHDLETSTAVARWAYHQVELGGRKVWLRKDDMVDLTPRWRDLLACA